MKTYVVLLTTGTKIRINASSARNSPEQEAVIFTSEVEEVVASFPSRNVLGWWQTSAFIRSSVFHVTGKAVSPTDAS